MDQGVCLVYESPGVQRVTGETIRPGGLALTRRAVTLAGLQAGDRVLDVGCGLGATVNFLAERGLHAVGIDLSAKLLRQGSRQFPQRLLTQGRGEMLPFATGRFDALLAECCLSLMPSPAQALAEFSRVLRVGGTLILSDMVTRSPDSAPGEAEPRTCCVSGAFYRPHLEALLGEAGFELAWWEDQTEALKQLAVQIIWEYGSLAGFWSCAGQADKAVTRTKPGYVLLLAARR